MSVLGPKGDINMALAQVRFASGSRHQRCRRLSPPWAKTGNGLSRKTLRLADNVAPPEFIFCRFDV
jgi:hypothetical protein